MYKKIMCVVVMGTVCAQLLGASDVHEIVREGFGRIEYDAEAFVGGVTYAIWARKVGKISPQNSDYVRKDDVVVQAPSFPYLHYKGDITLKVNSRGERASCFNILESQKFDWSNNSNRLKLVAAAGAVVGTAQLVRYGYKKIRDYRQRNAALTK